MKKVDISSMFLVPKNIYTSMLSRIYEDDTKEEIKLINREKDDGNYIEKAIDFNNQQERQRNQVLVKPNLTNETVRTNANTDANTDAYTTIQNNNINETVDNTEKFYTPMINKTANAGASTLERNRAASQISGSPLPFPSIEESLTERDAEGNFICKFCYQQFSEASAINNHLLNAHHANINRYERTSIINKNLKNDQNLNFDNLRNLNNLDDVEMSTSNNTEIFQSSTPASSFIKTGARPKETPIFGNRNQQNLLPSFKDFVGSPITKTSTPIQNTTNYRDVNKTPASEIRSKPHGSSLDNNETIKSSDESFLSPRRRRRKRNNAQKINISNEKEKTTTPRK